MPWLSIPFSDLETKKALNRKFEVEGIPYLIILQPDGSTLHDGVELIYRYGIEAFPFTEEKLEELRREERIKHESQTLTNLLTNPGRDYLLDQTMARKVCYLSSPACRSFCPFTLTFARYPHPTIGFPFTSEVPVDSLIGKTVGLYFSAQWCFPCAKFTPKLISIYHKIKRSLEGKGGGEDFEIVFVSNDCDQSSFDSYYGTMPWLALPSGDPIIRTLAKYFDVQGIPCLIIIDPDGKTVTKQGRNLINLYQENAYPFTCAKLELLEKEMEEEAKRLPRSNYHAGHRHELTLVSEGNGGGPFICCDCDEQGSGWAYQCLGCGYEVHPRCMRAVDPATAASVQHT
ncbi:hypothetical protein ES288_D01G126600v1 [Gossypium darwinii]|uniref:protein-disulfide reductase n=1 Tax=Gossypium darwinii TaxID=34276 RepID=A0A5D2DPB2_GOSDA|nr:hypothetical protein ES288_D01G126600v1 [Gossypium darwinii]